MISNNILAVLEQFVLDNPDDIAMDIAKDFRKRRIEKDLSQKSLAKKSGVPLATLRRFESTGQISLRSLIALAIGLGYTSEMASLFRQPKYQTMQELAQINSNQGKHRAGRSQNDTDQ